MGLNLWTVNQATIDLVQGTSLYSLASDVVDTLDVVLRRTNTDYEVQRISRGDYVTLP